jgi:hypothetical protein
MIRAAAHQYLDRFEHHQQHGVWVLACAGTTPGLLERFVIVTRLPESRS